MKKLLFISFAAAGMLATSCQDFSPWDGDIVQYEYRKDFQKAFGNIDPNHTWNTAAQRTMEFQINVPGTFNLRIFTTNPKTSETGSELLANYTNNGQGYESGDSYTISFDCPSGLRKVWADIQYVGSQRHIIQQVEMDMEGYGKAVFGEKKTQTRATIVPRDGVIQKTGKKEIFTLQAYTGSNDAAAHNKGFIDVIPENQHNVSKEDVHTDFVYVSSGEPYHLYPIYIYTGATVTVGVQYRQDAESDWNAEEITMLTTTPTDGDRVTRLFSAEASGRTAIAASELYPTAPVDFFENIKYDGTNTATATYYDGGYDRTSSGARYATLYKQDNSNELVPNFIGTLCDEIELNIPEGYEFRFWVEQNLSDGRSFKRYSDKESNSDKQIYFGTFNNGHRHKDQPVLYLGLEDWANNAHDINDIVFAFVGEIPTIIDEGGPHYLDAEYVIAYEDMGANDFDFNDIVIGVQHVSGETKANVNILACGGTLPVYLGFNDHGDTKNQVCTNGEEIPLFDGKELHCALSGNTSGDAYKIPLNVRGDKQRVVNRSELDYTPDTCKFTVTEHFSIVDKAKFFKLKVKHDPDGEIVSEITTPDTGKGIKTTPQAFVVSYTAWEWPTEGTLITDVYDDFKKWVDDHKIVDGYAWYKPIWSGLDDFSSNVDYSTTLRPSYSFDICLRTREEIETFHTNAESDVVTVEIPYSVFVGHKLQDYQNLVMAFVVTNRQVGQEPTIKVYKNSVENGNEIGGKTLVFSDASTTSTTSSYGDADKLDNVAIGSLGESDKIIVVFNRNSRSGDGYANDKKCHLNSIWAARPDKNVKMLDYEDIIGYTEVENLHDGTCNFNADNTCTNSSHVVEHTVTGKLTKVDDQIEVAIANSSTTRPNFLVCNALKIQHQHSIASMIANAQTIATSIKEDEKSGRFILKVVKMDGSTPIVSIYSDTKKKYLTKNGTGATWSDTCVTTYKLCRGTGGSRTSCIPGWDDDDMFRFQACDASGNNITNYYFNADGPQFKTGNGEWSLWYMFEIIKNPN